MCKFLIKLYLVIQLVLMLYVHVAVATTVTSSVAVSANVASSCNVTVSPLGFGVYVSTADLLGITTISITCTNTTPYNIGLNAGLSTGATVTTRKMTNGSNTLSYSLYKNSGRTTNWGNTVGTDTVSGVGNGTAQTITIYGKIPMSQNVAPGAYTDTVQLTVTF